MTTPTRQTDVRVKAPVRPDAAPASPAVVKSGAPKADAPAASRDHYVADAHVPGAGSQPRLDEVPLPPPPARAEVFQAFDPRYDFRPDERAFLQKYGFDFAAYRKGQDALRDGKLKPEDSLYRGTLKPPAPGAVAVLPAKGSAEADELAAVGRAHLDRTAVVIYAGGMAARFGGGVKGAVDVLPGMSFLEDKIRRTRELGEKHGVKIPIVLMTSYATTEGTLAHLEERGLMGDDIRLFEQGVSVRRNLDGSIYRDAKGDISVHGPGHGDFFRNFQRSGMLADLRNLGIQYVFTSNVDNLGATLDEKVLGQHITSGKSMTAEVVKRTAEDRPSSGAAVDADGRVRLLEGMRFPPEVDGRQFENLSINSFTYSLDDKAWDAEIPMTRHIVHKKVDGTTVVQEEEITPEVTEASDADGKPLFSLNLLQVPREGPKGAFYDGRFYEVKERSDMAGVANKLQLTRLREAFEAKFPGAAENGRLWFAESPGRINLIGEHTDYSDGLSLPAAINLKVRGAFQPIDENDPDAGKILLHSNQLDQPVEFSLSSPPELPHSDWGRYVASVVKVLQPVADAQGVKLKGLRGVIDSDIPVGSGLSSSAALELLFLKTFAEHSGLKLSKDQLATLGQQAEWEYGVKCGVMDQMAIAHGQKDTVSRLDVRAMESKPVKIDLKDHAIVVGFTKERTLHGSEYDNRRAEVEAAAKAFAALSGDPSIKTLRDVTPEMFERYASKLSDPAVNPDGLPLEKRARHVVYENVRVDQAIDALQKGDVDAACDLLVQTHRSLSEDFEVSSPELDAMVEAAVDYGKAHGVSIGARMMGGGFGGPTILLVPKDHVTKFKEAVGQRFTEATGLTGKFWDVSIEDGPSVAPAE